MKLLDCTLRDGGYYNNWEFSDDVVTDYIRALVAGGVHAIELGFRFLDSSNIRGFAAFVPDRYVEKIISFDTGPVCFAVMVNGSDLLTYGNTESDIIRACEELFPNPASNSIISLVRIACHSDELFQMSTAVSFLTDNGFDVGLNLMQVCSIPELELVKAAKFAESCGAAMFYFADSLGSLCPDDVSKLSAVIRQACEIPIGAHLHNNKGMALANAEAAIASGVEWIDATVMGMGRGPGNVLLEELLCSAIHENRSRTPSPGWVSAQDYKLQPVLEVIEQHFAPLKKYYGWGPNVLYRLAAELKVHPTYVQVLLARADLSESERYEALLRLSEFDVKRFSPLRLNLMLEPYSGVVGGKLDPRTIFSGKDILLLGSGENLGQHFSAIVQLVAQKQLVVVGLNLPPVDTQLTLDYSFVSHPSRIQENLSRFKTFGCEVICPYSMLSDAWQKSLSELSVIDYGIDVGDSFGSGVGYCKSPSLLVLSYALATLSAGNARTIFMSGVDLTVDDKAQRDEISEVVHQFLLTASNELEIYTLTNSNLPIPEKSVFGLLN